LTENRSEFVTAENTANCLEYAANMRVPFELLVASVISSFVHCNEMNAVTDELKVAYEHKRCMHSKQKSDKLVWRK